MSTQEHTVPHLRERYFSMRLSPRRSYMAERLFQCEQVFLHDQIKSCAEKTAGLASKENRVQVPEIQKSFLDLKAAGLETSIP